MASSDNFRINLKQAMAALGISQDRLADLAGMKQPYVCRVLGGSTCPRGPQYDRLAAAVGKQTWQLMMTPKDFSEVLLTSISE